MGKLAHRLRCLPSLMRDWVIIKIGSPLAMGRRSPINVGEVVFDVLEVDLKLFWLQLCNDYYREIRLKI